jgi:hypothetical protein
MFTTAACCATVETTHHCRFAATIVIFREAGGLITTETVTLELAGGLGSQGRPRREGQP